MSDKVYPGIEPNDLNELDYENTNEYFKAYNEAWEQKLKWLKDNPPPKIEETTSQKIIYELTRTGGCLEAIFTHFVGPVLFFFIAGLLLSGIFGFWNGITEFIKALFAI